MTTRLALFVAAAALPPLFAQAPTLPPSFESYLAHIAAAEGAMARGATGAVRRWLDAVPPGERAFEWHVLDAEADQSSAAHALHEGGVSTLALSPDGGALATAGNDGVVKLWKVASMELVRTIEAHAQSIYCLEWDKAGARLASSSADRGAKVWNVATGELISTFPNHTYPVTTIRFAPDGERLCSTSYQRPKGGEVRIWRASDGQELAVLQSGYAPITCSHWSRDGQKIVAASWDQHLHVFDLAAPEQPLTARLGAEPEYRAAQASALSPNGELVAVACKDDQVHLFEAWTGAPLRDFVGHGKIVEGVVFSPDGTLLASCSADTSVRLWDVATGAQLARLRGHRGLVRTAAFSPDGSTLCTASADGTVRTWDVAKSRHAERRIRFAETAYHIQESPDGKTLAVGFANGDLRLFDTDDGRELATLPKQASWIGCLQWSPDGAELLSAGDTGVQIWNVADATAVRTFSEMKGVDAAARTADGRLLAAVSRDKKVRLWDANTGELRWTVETKAVQTRLAFAPDSSVLAVAGQAGAALHDPATGEVRTQLAGHRGRVSAIRFVPNGNELVTVGDDGSVRVWNPADGSLLASIANAHDGSGRAAAVAPDGARFATCGEDDRLVLWDTAARTPVWSRDVKDGYCLDWSRDGRRLWVLPLGKEVFCFDAVPVGQR